MKASELCQQLAALIFLHGDRPVFLAGEVGEPLARIDLDVVLTSTPCGCAGDDVPAFVLKTSA